MQKEIQLGPGLVRRISPVFVRGTGQEMLDGWPLHSVPAYSE